jgi:shikimate dehydrogenase
MLLRSDKKVITVTSTIADEGKTTICVNMALSFALIGKKLGHSFSANFFNSKFKIEEIDADYQLLEIEKIEDIKEIIKSTSLDGFNVTIPYKESIIPYLDLLDDAAREVGAVNCVEIKDGKLIGHNTDIRGIDASLHWLDIQENTKAIVLGTGGASKAVQYVLKQRGIDFVVVSRDAERGDITYEALTSEMIASHKLIINTTPVGMFPNVDDAPNIDYSALGEEHRVFDLVYNPATTRFLSQAQAQGAQTMGGMMMLQTQAIASWHLWSMNSQQQTPRTETNIC